MIFFNVGRALRNEYMIKFCRDPDHVLDITPPPPETSTILMIWGFVDEIAPKIIKAQYSGEISILGILHNFDRALPSRRSFLFHLF